MGKVIRLSDHQRPKIDYNNVSFAQEMDRYVDKMYKDYYADYGQEITGVHTTRMDIKNK